MVCSSPSGTIYGHFLEEMRLQQQYHMYWIDAICIKQNDVSERNHQVQNMRQIYSNATLVSIWLDSTDHLPHSNAGMKFLSSGKQARSCTYEQARGIVELCSRGYWSRVWIIQEIMLAKECTIYYRNMHTSLSRLYTLVGEVRDFYALPGNRPRFSLPRILLGSPAAIIVLTTFEDGYWLGTRKFVPFMRLLELYRHQQATNILDKVYALHGLALDSDPLEIYYSISSGELAVKLLQFACDQVDPRDELIKRRKQLMNVGEIVAQILNVEWSQDEIRFKVTIMDD